MTATPYKIYVVFKNMSVEGKYIPLLYSANDVVDANAVLPSDSTTYTFPSGTDVNNKEEYIGYSNVGENEESAGYSNIGEIQKTEKKRFVY